MHCGKFLVFEEPLQLSRWIAVLRHTLYDGWSACLYRDVVSWHYRRRLILQSGSLRRNSHHQSNGLAGQCILRREITGRYLALPQSVVKFQGGRSHPQRTVAVHRLMNYGATGPFIFLRVHPYRFVVLLPRARPSFLIYFARQQSVLARIHFRVSRLLREPLQLQRLCERKEQWGDDEESGGERYQSAVSWGFGKVRELF